jgi:hypothetical protein
VCWCTEPSFVAAHFVAVTAIFPSDGIPVRRDFLSR